MPAERIFADANLFLRYLTNDIPEQAQAFEGLLRGAARGQIIFVTTSLVLADRLDPVIILPAYQGGNRPASPGNPKHTRVGN